MRLLRKLTAVCALLAGTMLLPSCGNGSDDKLDNIDLIPVKLTKDGNWSMINANGEVVFDSEFKNEPSYSYNGFFSVEENDGYTLYKEEKGKPVAVKGLEGLKAVGYVEDNLVPVVYKNSRITIVDTKGEKKFELGPVNGVEVTNCDTGFEGGMLRFKTDENLYGYYDTSGNVAIKPAYKSATSFSEGVAVVSRESHDSTSVSSHPNYEVIDKKGNTVFKIKEGYELNGLTFQGGYLETRNDDRIVLFDKKGEYIKLPAKIRNITAISGGYLIYSDEEGEYGVADIKGEIIIRAKYDELMFAGPKSFFAQKKGNEKEVIYLNEKGEETKTLDFEAILPAGKFGYFAKDGNTYSQLDKDFKPKTKEEFYDIGLTQSASYWIESDYFNPGAIAKIIASYFEGDKVGKYKLGEQASTILKEKNPEDYRYSSKCDFPDLDKKGFRYDITFTGHFTESIADYDYNYYGPSTYHWNTDAKLFSMDIDLSCRSDWGKEGQKELVEAFKAKGFKIVKEGDSSSHEAMLAAMKKGTVILLIGSDKKGRSANILAFQTTLVPEIENYILEQITTPSKDDPSKESDEEVEVVEVAEDYPYYGDTVEVVEVAEVAE